MKIRPAKKFKRIRTLFGGAKPLPPRKPRDDITQLDPDEETELSQTYSYKAQLVK